MFIGFYYGIAKKSGQFQSQKIAFFDIVKNAVR